MGTGGPKKRSRIGVRGDDIASEVINHFWMGYPPETMSVTYSRLHWKLGLRFAEAQSMGVGFTGPPVPLAPFTGRAITFRVRQAALSREGNLRMVRSLHGDSAREDR